MSTAKEFFTFLLWQRRILYRARSKGLTWRGESLAEEIMFSVLKDTAEFEKPLINEYLAEKDF